MRLGLALLAALALALGAPPRPPAHAQPPPAAEGFAAVHFVDAQHGWLGGHDTVLATADGGQTWDAQAAAAGTVYAFAFLDAQTGWALGTAGLFGTRDGGQQWELLAAGHAPTQVAFVSPEEGWGLAPGPGAATAGRLVATTDGGRTWQPLTEAIQAQALCRADATHGWAANRGTVWRTTDGGRTWSNVLESPALSGLPEGATVGFVADVQCLDAATAWVLFTHPGGMSQTGWALYRTADGGATWTPVAQSGQFFPQTGAPAGRGGWGHVRLAAVDAETAYVVGVCVPCSPPGSAEAGTVSLGVARGAAPTWEDLPPVPGLAGAAALHSAPALSFPTPAAGWLVAPGAVDVVWATSDGGRIWQQRTIVVP
jgi:photosystem II stability/assembly factor-like uncharacterized protein